MPANYFWNGKEVIVVEEQLKMHTIPKRLLTLMCVDTFADSIHGRYGNYNADADHWVYIPLEEFPTEFRTHLLLLGVT